MKRKYRTNLEVQVEYFQEHPEEVEVFLEEVFNAYAEDGNTAVLLASLRIVAQVKGLTDLSRDIDMSRQGLYKALSEDGNPRLENINAIMHSLGYRLKVEPLEPTR